MTIIHSFIHSVYSKMRLLSEYKKLAVFPKNKNKFIIIKQDRNESIHFTTSVTKKGTRTSQFTITLKKCTTCLPFLASYVIQKRSM